MPPTRTPPVISVLLVEDNHADARLLREALYEGGGTSFQLTHANTLAAALQRLDSMTFDVVLLDLSLPDADGLDTLVRTHERAPSVPIVVLTGLNDEDLATRAVREGAQDYLVKGQVDGQLLVRAMRYATERKRAIEALQRSEEYYRSLIENALDIIVVLGSEGNILYGSPSFERVLGYPAGALTRSNVFELVHPDDRAKVRAIMKIGNKNPGATKSFECRLCHRNGTWRVMETIGKHFEGETTVNGYVLNSRDITERKRGEEALRQAKETLQAVIETSPLAIYRIDTNGEIKSWNTAAQTIFGLAESEVLNRSIDIVFSAAEQNSLVRIAEALDGHLAVAREEHLPRKDGTLVEVTVWNAQLRDGSGKVIGVVEVVADNTDRKRLELQFRQIQKMDAVGLLAGGIAHDFNNLLTVITGYCEMMLDQIDPATPIHEDVKEVLKASERATALTKQLLAFSRKQIVQPRVIDLHQLVQDTEQLLRRLVGTNIEIAIHPPASVMKVRADPGHLEQVIVNLVVNARDAMPEGGRIEIWLRSEFHPADASLVAGSYVVLELTDTGTGIDEDTQKHLFDPFFTTKEKGRGTGLGLSTSYGIVKQNHGEITFSSTLGQGTRFYIYLPEVAEPLDFAPPIQKSPRSYSGRETILLAEDEDGVRTVMTEMLEKRGYVVLPVNGGVDALQAIQSHPGKLDLLVTDVIMPKMSGRDLAEKAVILRPGLKVLYVSGYTGEIMDEGGELEEGTDLLQKPFTPDELAAKVREVLGATLVSPQESAI